MVNNNQKNTIPGNSFTVTTLVFFNVLAITFDPGQAKFRPNKAPDSFRRPGRAVLPAG
jgi:hypothetical protein